MSAGLGCSPAAALLGAASYLLWSGLDDLVGRSLRQAVSVLGAIAVGSAVYAPRCGSCACPRRGRSSACSLVAGRSEG